MQLVKMKLKVFFMIFQGLSDVKNCFKSETAHITILGIKWELLHNFAKNFKCRSFMGHIGTNFQLQLNSKSSKLPSSLKKYVKNTYFGPKEKRPFFQILLWYHILVPQGLTS